MFLRPSHPKNHAFFLHPFVYTNIGYLYPSYIFPSSFTLLPSSFFLLLSPAFPRVVRAKNRRHRHGLHPRTRRAVREARVRPLYTIYTLIHISYMYIHHIHLRTHIYPYTIHHINTLLCALRREETNLPLFSVPHAVCCCVVYAVCCVWCGMCAVTNNTGVTLSSFLVSYH